MLVVNDFKTRHETKNNDSFLHIVQCHDIIVVLHDHHMYT